MPIYHPGTGKEMTFEELLRLRRQVRRFWGRLFRRFLVIVAVVGVGVWYITRDVTRKAVIAEFEGFQRVDDSTAKAIKTFWPDEPLRAEGKGYLTSKNLIPLRAIARRPNLALFPTSDLTYSAAVERVMTPWVPYYVFDKDKKGKAIQIGETPLTKEAERYWVEMDQAFCWTTREALSIEKPVPVYRSLVDAKAGQNPVDTAFRYAFTENFIPARDNVQADNTGKDKAGKDKAGKDKAEKEKTESEKAGKPRFNLAALPVIARQEDSYWAVVSPQGSQQGYELRWLKWDGKTDDIQVRLRTTRHELESYLADLQRLLKDWRIQAKKDQAHRDLVATAINYRVRDKAEASSLPHLKARRSGIAKLDGFLENPIESELQYDKLSERTVTLLEWSNSPTMWAADEVSYPLIRQLP